MLGMKKILLIMGISMMAALAGCAGSLEEDAEASVSDAAIATWETETSMSDTVNVTQDTEPQVTNTDDELRETEAVLFGYRYDEKLDGIVITHFTWDVAATIVIPGNIDGSPVVRIGENAFYDCSNITNIIIPDSVISIGNDAFSGCESLTGIVIPDSVTSIGNSAFSGCESLTSIVIPGSVASIRDAAFSDCSALTDVTLSEGIVSIDNWAFRNCTSLTDITIPDSVTTIHAYAFQGCDNLTDIVIPDSVMSMGYHVFSECSSLTDITVPDNITMIRYKAFEGCDDLTVHYRGQEYDSSDFDDLYSMFSVFIEPSEDDKEQAAREAYSAFLSGDVSQVDDTEFGQHWLDYHLPYIDDNEYMLMDLDGDGVSELLLQYIDYPRNFSAVFYYSDGRLFWWAFDTMDGSSWQYPLQNGIMLHQYESHSAMGNYFHWAGFRYLPDGSSETLFKLIIREDRDDDEMLTDPCYEIDGVEVDQMTFEAALEEMVTSQIPERSAWTAIL